MLEAGGQAAAWAAWAGIAVGTAGQVLHVLLRVSALDADEAVVGLMAKHILEGRETPVFFYGQDYFGALEAYLTVPFFALLGISTVALRLVPLLSSLAMILLVYRLGRPTFGHRQALIAAALTALPPLFYFDFVLRARGGFSLAYALMLLLACLCLGWTGGRSRPEPRQSRTESGSDSTIRSRDECPRQHPGADSDPRSRRQAGESARAAGSGNGTHGRGPVRSWRAGQAFGFGVLCGLLLYLYQAALFHVAAVLAAALWLRGGPGLRALPLWTGGVLLGMLPMLVYNWVHPLATVIQAAGHKYLQIDVPAMRDQGLVTALLAGLQNRLAMLGEGLGHLWKALAGRPPVDSGWPEVLLAALWTTAVLWTLWVRRSKLAGLLRRHIHISQVDGLDLALLLFAVTFAAGYSSWHYLLFCYPLAALMLAGLLHTDRPHWLSARVAGWLPAIVLSAALALNANSLSSKLTEPQPSPRWHQLIADLEDLKLERGYSGYWIAYPVNFLSHERLLLSPLAGPVTMDRYPPHSESVGEAARVVYVLQTGSQSERNFLQQLSRLDVQPQTRQSGPYTLFFGVSQETRTRLAMPFAPPSE
ncbi:MAG TPA: glycosyltransferase family 39 protein [Acidobacteriota bacterium]|nr:glycosyltransferase family 39 protein [Acidobacteriota bacterium]